MVDHFLRKDHPDKPRKIPGYKKMNPKPKLRGPKGMQHLINYEFDSRENYDETIIEIIEI